jgi:hypothetical protein
MTRDDWTQEDVDEMVAAICGIVSKELGMKSSSKTKRKSHRNPTVA